MDRKFCVDLKTSDEFQSRRSNRLSRVTIRVWAYSKAQNVRYLVVYLRPF
jgi:hypothetical protein